MDWGVRGWHRGWLQARVPDPEHPEMRGGTKTVAVRAIRACLIMMHTGKDVREEEGSGVLFAGGEQQAWASQRQLLKGPNSTSLARIRLEGRARGGLCWDKSQQDPGCVWRGNGRENRAGHLTQRHGSCAEALPAPPTTRAGVASWCRN